MRPTTSVIMASQDLPLLAWTVMVRLTNTRAGPRHWVPSRGAPGAIGEADRPPAFKGSKRQRRGAIGASGGLGTKAEQGLVLVPIEGLV